VIGDFRTICKDDEVSVDKHVYCTSHIEATWDCCDKNDLPELQKNKAKAAFTNFKFIHYDAKSNQSVVKAFPRTGRTHQIRVHLKSIGYPIANDQVYAGPNAIINENKKTSYKVDDFKNSY